jgi:hypothetical protein
MHELHTETVGGFIKEMMHLTRKLLVAWEGRLPGADKTSLVSLQQRSPVSRHRVFHKVDTDSYLQGY